MTIEQDLAEYLVGQTSFTTLVPATQIYPGFIPSDAIFPAVSVFSVSQTRDRTLDNKRINCKRIQIDVKVDQEQDGYGTLKLIETAIDNLVDGFTGYFSGSTNRVIMCHGGSEMETANDNSTTFHLTMQYQIDYTAAV